MGILRLAHVDVTVVDLDLAIAYYTEVMGHARRRARRRLRLPQVLGRGGPPLAAPASTHPRIGMDLMSFKVEREDDLSDLENAVTRYGFPVPGSRRASRSARASRSGSRRRPARPWSWSTTSRRSAASREAQPAPFVDRHPRHRAAAHGPPPGQRRGGRRGHVVLHGRPRLPHDRAAPRRQRPPDGRLAGAVALAARPRDRQRPERRRCTTSRSGSTTGTTCARSADILAYNGDPDRRRARRGTASRAATPSTSSTRSAPATRCSPAATARTPTSRRSPGPRTTSGGPSSTTRASSTTAS